MVEDAREALLDAARDAIARRGLVGLTLRSAASAAGVAPEVARRYYRNRDELVAAALRLPFDPRAAIPELIAPGLEGVGERLVRLTLASLRDPATREELLAVARGGVHAAHALASLQELLERAVIDPVAARLGVPDARMRSALIASYLIGVAATRYGLRLEPLASAGEEDVVRMVAPVIQDLLDPRHPVAPPHEATPG